MSQFNYFSTAEQRAQQQFKSWRDRLLAPVCRLLTTLCITPNILSGIGLVVLLPFVWLVVSDASPASVLWAMLALLTHLLIDGIDGPLARMQGKSGDAGSLVDMACDHLGMVIVATALVQAELLNGTLGCLYIFMYTTAVLFVVVLNQIGQPFHWVFRSKYALYALLGVYASTGHNWLWPAVICFVGSDAAVTFIGFSRLYQFLLIRQARSELGVGVDAESSESHG